MKYSMMARFKIIFLMLGICQTSLPITLVYNMKIRRAFAQARQLLGKDKRAIWVLSVLPIAYSRSRYFCQDAPLVNIREKRLVLGAIFNVRCIPSDLSWFELTTALENERSQAKGVSDSPVLPLISASYTGLDDLVISGGFNLYPTKKVQLVFYGIAGFPTHTKISVKDSLGTFVGTRFFSVGAGSEFSYSFINSLMRSLVGIFQNRYIHYFSRNWSPVLPCCSTIQPGDLVDLLFAVKFREKRDLFETGYNPTFFFNQSVKTPVTGKVRSEDFVRNGGYVTYAHLFDHLKHPVILGAGFSFNKAKVLDSRIFAGWLNFTIIF
jgi:hypothetical protein